MTVALVALAGCASKPAYTVSAAQRAAESSSVCLLGPFVRNADGSINDPQVKAGIDAAFARDDLNHDGKLTYDEISAANAARQGSCDTTSLVSWDGTGSIDRAQYGARYETAFLAADRNADGVATAQELATPVSARERADAKALKDYQEKVNKANKPDSSQIGNPTGINGQPVGY
jgi:hypothetical protein